MYWHFLPSFRLIFKHILSGSFELLDESSTVSISKHHFQNKNILYNVEYSEQTKFMFRLNEEVHEIRKKLMIGQIVMVLFHSSIFLSLSQEKRRNRLLNFYLCFVFFIYPIVLFVRHISKLFNVEELVLISQWCISILSLYMSFVFKILTGFVLTCLFTGIKQNNKEQTKSKTNILV